MNFVNMIKEQDKDKDKDKDTTLGVVIKNPNNAAHYMVIKSVERRIRIFLGTNLLAESMNALRLMEVGKSFYDPVIYVPKNDVKTSLQRLEKTSHCTLKGDASYFSYDKTEICWCYETPFEFAKPIKGYHAFWASKVRIEEGE